MESKGEREEIYYVLSTLKTWDKTETHRLRMYIILCNTASGTYIRLMDGGEREKIHALSIETHSKHGTRQQLTG